MKITATICFMVALSLIGCAIEEASPMEKQELIIASDYLKPQDTSLFLEFSKSTGIHIRIISMPPEKIKSHIQKFKANTQFDLVMLGSLSSVLELQGVGFHVLSDSYLAKYANNLKTFQQRQWFVSGLDPYYFSFERDSTSLPEVYDQLGAGFLWASPDKETWDLFDVHLSYYLSGLNEQKRQNIRDQFIKNQVEYFQPNDSMRNEQFLLLKNSTYSTNKSLNSNPKRELSKTTNLKAFGVYADRKCMAIVDQARNLGNANEFISYWDEHYYRENFIPGRGDYPYPDKNGISNGLKFYMLTEDKLLQLLKKENFK